MEFEDESPAVAQKPAAVVKKPSAVPNVNDEGSSANDSKPALAQFFGKKGSKPHQGEATKKKKRSRSLQKK